MDGSGQSEEKTLPVEGRGCVFGRQVVLGYPPETETQVRFRVSTKSGELHTDHDPVSRRWRCPAHQRMGSSRPQAGGKELPAEFD